MLSISHKQLLAFPPLAERAFVSRVVEYLRNNYPETTIKLPAGIVQLINIPDNSIFEMVEIGISRARKYGIRWESNLAAFVILMFLAAPNFDRQTQVLEVLRSNAIEPESKIDELWEWTTDTEWELIDKSYDPTAWNLNFMEFQ